MKREGMRHPKTLDLMARLSINRREAVGLLDMLLDWAIDYAPCGDIGKWSNGVICGSVDWPGNADDLVSALVGSGWLDEDKEHRLVIHDWPDHAPMFLRAKLKKVGLSFLSCYSVPDDSLEASLDGDTPPLPAPPLPANPAPSPPRQRAAAAAEIVSESDWKEATPIARKLSRLIRPSGTRLTDAEREWAAKVAVLSRRRGDAWLNVALEGMKRKGIKDPQSYMHKLLDDECDRAGTRLNRELSQINIPADFIKPVEKVKVT